MRHWREGKLGDAMRIKHGFAFKGEFFADEGSHIVLTPGNFRAEGGLNSRVRKRSSTQVQSQRILSSRNET